MATRRATHRDFPKKKNYELNRGATFGATVTDSFEPMIEQILKRIAPEVGEILREELLNPVLEPARKQWPVGNYKGQRTSRQGGVSKAALHGAIQFDGNNIYAVIRNNAKYRGRLYAYLIFFAKKTRFIQTPEGRFQALDKKIFVWPTLVHKPFLKLAKKLEGPLLEAIDRAAGGR
jgi:hypothetical protein